MKSFWEEGRGSSLKRILWGKQNVGDKKAHGLEERKIIGFSSHKYSCKYLVKVVARKIQTHLKKIVYNAISVMQSSLSIRKFVNETYYPNPLKNFLKLPMDSGKNEFDKCQHLYMTE